MTGRALRITPPQESRLGLPTRPAHLCPECQTPLDIEGGVMFSTMGGKPRISKPHWCASCGAHLTVTWRLSGSEVKIAVERAK